MNRLAAETSPYLRQHRDNPVDWYPWGDEAFARALVEDRPVMLSVGYSSCHWCHVMAHESFEDEGTAALLNERFVSVKVDREERPDVDAVYMEAVQAITGRGGWPMTVFLTPDRRPFYGGTYFPKGDRGGMPSFTTVLQAIDAAWRERRDEVIGQAEELVGAVVARVQIPSTEAMAGRPVADSAELLQGGFAALQAAYDPAWGGFGSAPKFPQPSMLELALRAHDRTGGDAALTMVSTTLDAMASGGIYDHLGGGFARYSVDGRWMVPHFEKMLYDQAGLARIYLHGWQVTGSPQWRQVLEETVAYVLRDLRAPGGGLFSAEDADSEGVEGRFYVWSLDEVTEVLGPELAPSAIDWYGITAEGNFEGSNILHRPQRGDLLRPPAIERARRLLFEHRARRVRPGLDDKVLTEWNAMFCSTLAEAAAATGRSDWRDEAVSVAEFLLRSLRRSDGRWLRSWQGGKAGHLAVAADYAWLVDAFTRLSELTGQARWIETARDTAKAMLMLFWDVTQGGLFTTGEDAERLIVRSKELFDGATPSASSVGATALARLGALTGEQGYTDCAMAILATLGEVMAAQPTAFTHALGAVDLLADGVTEIAVTGDRPDLVEAAHRRYLPRAVLAWGEPYPSPLWDGRGDGMAYVCRDYACLAPTSRVEDLEAQLTTR
ncbi:MAG: thioredoxin domain-containing protein [Actinobacteria bacterium]|nr:MAG: thioredoxin domain-containing protein [Actinomycetota bacterium]